MENRFDLIVFDWDGTLMDSAEAIVRSIRAASLDAGFPAPEPDAARHVIGLGLNEAMACLFPDADVVARQRLSERYRHHYLSASEEGIHLFEGARKMISDLHDAGYLLAVATGKGRSGLDSVMRRAEMGPYFHSTRCADECFSKPHPAMLLELMQELGTIPERTLMIGDTTHDLQMAKNAGVASVALAHGAHPRENLEPLAPLACLNDFIELRTWFERDAHG